MKTKTTGLAGIIAGDSSICLCGQEDQSLLYRGYSIEDLAKHATFEEVAWLLLRGDLPSQEQLEEYQNKLSCLRDLPNALKEILERIPANSDMMEVMRTGCSALGNFEPETATTHPIEIADRLIASLPSLLLYWYQFHKTGKRIDLNTETKSHAEHILTLILGKKPTKEHTRCLDVSLILYAEHEFNASTFTVRSIASTLSDFYSAITGGIGALRGPLHGGANEKAMELIQQFTTPDEAEKGILEMLSKKQLIMGFGHRVYTTHDPRSPIIQEWSRTLAQEIGDTTIFPISERIDEVMRREKKLFTNLDFYSASAYHFLNIPSPMFTPLFVISRITGWSAHLIEQRQNNKLIRPLSNYTGSEPRKWIAIDQR